MSSSDDSQSVVFHQVADVVRQIFGFLFLDNILSGSAGVCKMWNEIVFDGTFITEHRAITSVDKFVSVEHRDPKRLAFDWIELISNKYPELYDGLNRIRVSVTGLSLVTDQNPALSEFRENNGVQFSMLGRNGKPVKLSVVYLHDRYQLLVGAYLGDSPSTKFESAELFFRIRYYDGDRELMDRWANNYDWLKYELSDHFDVVPPGLFWSVIQVLATSFTAAPDAEVRSWIDSALNTIGYECFEDRFDLVAKVRELAVKRLDRLKDPNGLFDQAVSDGVSSLCRRLLVYDYTLSEAQMSDIVLNSIKNRWNGDMVRFLFEYGRRQNVSVEGIVETHKQDILIQGKVDLVKALHENNVQLPNVLYDTAASFRAIDNEVLNFLTQLHPDFYCPYDLRHVSSDNQRFHKVLFLYHNDEARTQLNSILEGYSTGKDDSKRATLKYSFKVIPPKILKNKRLSADDLKPLEVAKHDIVLYLHVLPDTSISESKLEGSLKVIQALKRLCPSVVYTFSVSTHVASSLDYTVLNRTMLKVLHNPRPCRFIHFHHMDAEETLFTMQKLDQLFFPTTDVL